MKPLIYNCGKFPREDILPLREIPLLYSRVNTRNLNQDFGGKIFEKLFDVTLLMRYTKNSMKFRRIFAEISIGHQRRVTSVDFHPLVDSVVATSSSDFTVRLWDISKGSEKLKVSVKIHDGELSG